MTELTDIGWISEMYQKLVLPPRRKDLILAAVKQKSKVVDMDFVPGKGNTSPSANSSDNPLRFLNTPDAGLGLIVLMFGPPGTGKTLTAEAGESSPFTCDT